MRLETGYSRPIPAIPPKEIYRYMGLRGAEPAQGLQQKTEALVKRLTEAAEPRLTLRRLALSWSDTGIGLGGLSLSGQDIRRNLQGCQEAFLLAATLGSGVDRLMARLDIGDSADALILQAIATACLEELLDLEEERLKTLVVSEGLSLRPRFSPGYGDLPLSLQRGLLEILEAQKRLGLTLTESSMLVPQKSVTALIGLHLGEDPKRDKRPCERCARSDCPYQSAQ